MTNDNRPAMVERRVHHAIREVFERACVLLASLVKDIDKTLKTSGFAMVHMVRALFPELSGSDARIVIAAVERLHHLNRLQALPGKYAHE